MTRPAEEIERCLQLGVDGLNPIQIARITGVPRPTVRDWLAGRVPGSRRGDHGPGCKLCGQAEHVPEELPVSYVYLLGIYLGDGCISVHPRGVFRLRISLDARYPRIIDEVAEAVLAVSPRNPVGRVDHGGWIELSSYSRAWPCRFPQHGPGPKHRRPIFFAHWQVPLVERRPESLLRGLIHSDGCRFINTGYGWRHPRYSFSNASGDIRAIFCYACDLLGLRYTHAPRTVYVSRKADVARMDEFIGPKA